MSKVNPRSKVLCLFSCSYTHSIGIESSVTWHNATRLLDARTLASSRGRVTVDIYDGLHINELQRKDNNPYHCYVDGKRRATFRLVGKLKLIFIEHIEA